MKHILLVASLLTAGCITTVPTVVPKPDRPMSVHTCVSGSFVWIDGANVPAEFLEHRQTDKDGNITYPSFPATLAAFNLHASSPSLPEYGTVIHAIPSNDPLIVILGSCAK